MYQDAPGNVDPIHACRQTIGRIQNRNRQNYRFLIESFGSDNNGRGDTICDVGRSYLKDQQV